MEDEIINIVPGVNWSHLSDDNYTQELNGSDSSGTESSEFMSNTEVSIHTQDPSGLSEESADIEDDAEDMQITASWSHLPMEEGAVDGQENQSSDKESESESYILTHNDEVEPMPMTLIADDYEEIDLPAIQFAIDLSSVENASNTENESNTEDLPSTGENVQNVVNPPEQLIMEVDANMLPSVQPIFEDEEMELLNFLEQDSKGKESEPKLVDAKDLYAYPKALVQCAVCDEKFTSKSFKFHNCELDESPGSMAANNNTMRRETSFSSLDSSFAHAKRLIRENQVRTYQFFKTELQYDLKTGRRYEKNESDADATESFKKQNDSHECTLCGRKFVHASGLSRHMETHDVDEMPLLAGSIPNNEDPEKFMNAVAKCTTCGRIFFDCEEAVSHYLNHVPPIWESYDPNKNYALHLEDAMKLVTYMCNREETNGLATQSPQSSEPGMEINTIMSVFQCEFCDFLFTDMSFLLMHSAHHVPDRPFECFSCEIYMHSLKEISAHWKVECVFRRELIKRHEMNALCYFVCNVCEQKFLSHELLSEHRYTEYHFFPRMNKRLGKLQLPCEYCRSVFNCVPDIVAHYEQQHYTKEMNNSMPAFQERPYLCELCGKTYTQSSHLWQHLRFHQGIKPFMCKEPGCERKFTIRPDLSDHVRKCHTGDRPYLCVQCNKRFLTGSVYYQHRLIHRKERRFECHQCSKRFYRADALKNHQRIHTGERPFECPYCTKRFRQRGDCDKHVRARHGHLDEDALQLLKVQKRRLEAIETAGGSNAALPDEGTSTEISTAEPPQQENINQDAKKDDMQDEKQKDKKVDLVVDSEGDGGDNLTVEVENDWQDDEQQRKPKYLSLPVLD